MKEKKVRRVRVTASVPGASEPVGQIAAPAELRTPTGIEPKPGSGKMRMEAGRRHERSWQTKTELLACHFLHPYYADLGHPSRLPSGSLCSAWTGPGRDPSRIPGRRKWQAILWRPRCASRWSEPYILPLRSNFANLFLTTSGLLMEGTESNRRRQPFQGCARPIFLAFGLYSIHSFRSELRRSLEGLSGRRK